MSDKWTSRRIRKKLGVAKCNGSWEAATENLSMDDVIEIARIMRPRSMAKELKGTVKEILGTAKSTGCTVEGEDPQDVQQSIEDGDIEIPDK